MDPKTTVRELMLSIAKKLNKSPEIVEPMVKKLEDDWFDTAESLKNISDEAWDAYSFPLRFVLEIKRELSSSHGEAKAAPSVEEKSEDHIPNKRETVSKTEFVAPHVPVSYTHLTLPTNREV
eukprot:TRINITY_DN4182_c0_g5_i1.p2 TRINITY_DN4182_c0_g5~~TRINITY_DN4182_c0_g5_i1.p2  ORF type:complete len:122 (+),score=28.25 TRINITY_DN4182_c0_g5_i1:170-535(+)